MSWHLQWSKTCGNLHKHRLVAPHLLSLNSFLDRVVLSPKRNEGRDSLAHKFALERFCLGSTASTETRLPRLRGRIIVTSILISSIKKSSDVCDSCCSLLLLLLSCCLLCVLKNDLPAPVLVSKRNAKKHLSFCFSSFSTR